MAPGATREDTLEFLRQVQTSAEALGARHAEEYGRNPIKFALGEIGGNTGRALPGPVCAMSFGVCAAAALGPVPGAVLSTLAMPWALGGLGWWEQVGTNVKR
jgi:hypothetical protein